MDKNKDKKVVVVSGPSGVGKSTICRKVVKQTQTHLCVSMTSRPKSAKEIDGQDYHFVSRDDFQKRINNNEFVEYAQVFGNFYGTPVSELEQAIAQNKTPILEIDVQGGMSVKRLYPDAVMVFILPPTQTDLAERMNGRGRGEDDATARKRLDQAGQETALAWQHYDHMVINDDLEQAVSEVTQIIHETTGD